MKKVEVIKLEVQSLRHKWAKNTILEKLLKLAKEKNNDEDAARRCP